MKKKVLLLQHEISRYNSPIFSLIGKQVDLTVGYFKTDNSETIVNYQKKEFSFYKVWRFFLLKGLHSYCKDFDVVIFDCNPICPSYYLLPFLKHRYKTITWTVGVRASYKRRYELPFPKRGIYYHVIEHLFRKVDAILFYMSEPINYWLNEHLKRDKFFTAHNTVKIIEEPIDWNKNRNAIIFVGSLYKEKKVDELVHCYINATKGLDSHQVPTLEIVGDGEMRNELEEIVHQDHMEHLITFHGAIFEENILKKLFDKSMICISPDQAGLSVLKSMGYGVPFATRDNAITGGERLNIKNGINGFLYKEESELVNIINKAISAPNELIQMGKNARNYYLKYATPEIMAQGFLDAITYALKH